jgi:hypothetical protein
VATRSHPAFAVSPIDFLEKTVTYEILRHPASATPADRVMGAENPHLRGTL